MHSKTILTFAGLLLSICGWFVWNFALGAIFPNDLNVYQVRGTFIQNFGRTLNYWATMVLLLLTLVSVELFWSAIRRVYFPNDTDIMQRVEKDDEMMRRMEAELDKERGEAEDESRVTKQQQLNDVPAVASTPPMPQHGRRPRNSEEYAGGKWGRPSADYNRQSTVGPVEEEAQGYSPPREMQRMRDRWV
jgi:phospholipid-translocating ATPase